MGITELLMTAVALSMDAFAVAVCKGLSAGKVKLSHMLICGAWFGGFQALMPLIGYFLGQTFESYITPVDHWVTFLLLGVIGFNMLKESLDADEEADCSLCFKIMLAMALATSIDALAVGITFALDDDVNIVFAISSIGVITFILSALGVKIGQVFGSRWRGPAEFVGGIVLIGIGIKILLEHTVADKSLYDLVIAQSVALLLTVIFSVFAVLTHKKDGAQKGELVLYCTSATLLFVTGLSLTALYFIIA